MGNINGLGLISLPLAPARDARARFAPGNSGNPRGRPRGIRNPRRRVPDLRVRPLSPEALSPFLDRKPHLLLPLARQVLPPRAAPIDPAERIDLDLLAVENVETFRAALVRIVAAVAADEISAREGGRLARRVRARLRLLRRLARLQKRLALTGGADPR